MSRPRIRTLKPEVWHDDKVAGVSRDARLLFVGLITLADDEGRFGASTPLILGHIFPWDGLSDRQLQKWLGELDEAELISRYTVAGKEYGLLPGWGSNQRINRPVDSKLPAPSLNGSAHSHHKSDD